MDLTARVFYRPALLLLTRGLLPSVLCVLWTSFSAAATSSIEVDTISSRTQRLLDQADALFGERQWGDAIDALDLVVEEGAGRLASAGEGRYVDVRQVTQSRLANLPPDALQLLRTRIDPTATALLEQARQQRDPEALRRIIDNYFASSATPDAILLLADLAIERGDYLTARGALDRLHPLLVGPTGRPVGIDLVGIDVAKYWEQIETILRGPRDLIPAVYPDADDRLAEGLLRLALISIRERDFERATTEVALLKQFAPNAIATIAGAQAPAGEALTTMLQEAQRWPKPPHNPGGSQLGGSANRDGDAQPVGEIVGAIWPEPISFTPAPRPKPIRRAIRPNIIINGRALAFDEPQEAPQESAPGAYPCVYGGWLLYRDRNTIASRDLMTGAPAVSGDGKLHVGVETPVVATNRGAIQLRQLRQFGFFVQGAAVAEPRDPWGPLQVDQGVLYARVVTDDTRRGGRGAEQEVIGISLLQDGLKVVEFQPPESPWEFSGPPLVADGLAYLALKADEIRPRIAIACYSATTGQQLWLTSLCTGPPTDGYDQQTPPQVLTKAGESLLLNTNLGAIAAVNAISGQVDWITEYPRCDEDQLQQRFSELLTSEASDRPDVAPCVFHRGRVLASPVDATGTLALDAASGRLLWSSPLPGPAAALLGARGDSLVCGGRVLTLIDVDTGLVKTQWPRSDRSGIRGRGRGCLAGDEVFWPTRESIYTFNALTGKQTRPPIDLTTVGDDGANLTPAHGMLVVAGAERLTVFGPYDAVPPEPTQSTIPQHDRDARLTPDPLTRNN